MKISNTQLAMLMMGFIFGTTAIRTAAIGAEQDAWIAYLIGWGFGFVIIGLYVYLALLNPSKTLIKISREQFGKYLGNIIGFLYIFYFLFDATIITRNFSEFMNVTVYPDTPILFIAVSFLLVVAYSLKNGIEILARVGELFVPITFVLILCINISFFSKFNVQNILPIFQHSVRPVLKVAYEQLTFPFGQVVTFLMIFPNLRNKNNIYKTSYLATLITGLIILSTVFRDLFVLGGDKASFYIYPFLASTKLFSTLMQPFPPILLITGILIKCAIFVYATALGIAQIFNLDDYKTFILPVIVLVVVLMIWNFDSLLEFLKWDSEIWPFYVIPFHFGIPLVLVVLSWLKNRRSNS